MKKKDKKPDWDDGRVIAPMNGDELPPHRRGFGNKSDPRRQDAPLPEMSKKEERALVRAMFLAMLPRLLVMLAGFSIIFLLGYFWLTH